MNALHAVAPVSTELDAVAALGRGDKLYSGSGDEDNTFGNATLISTTQALSVLHVMPYATSGYHTLPLDTSTTARVLRFRRLTGGTAPGGGGYANYFHVFVSGYRVPSPAYDIALLDLAVPVTHITPMPVDTGEPAVSDALVLAGWGLDGATAGAGSYPLDARKITTRTIATLYAGPGSTTDSLAWSGTNPGPNLYDSGGAVLRDVSGTFKITGVIQSYNIGHAISRHRNDATFQIPGFYAPSATEPASPSTWIQASFDTLLNVEDPTVDNSATTTLTVNSITGKATENKKAVLAFDVSGADTPIGATLNLTIALMGGTVDPQIRVRRIRRTGLTALANWNTYDGTNNWGTAGAENTTSDVYTANQITPAAIPTSTPSDTAYQINGSDLLAMVTAARNEDGILRLLIESVIDADASVTFWSKDNSLPSYRPYMELDYGGTTDGRGGRRIRCERSRRT